MLLLFYYKNGGHMRKLKVVFYRSLSLVLVTMTFLFAPLDHVLESRTGRIQSHAFVVESAVCYTIWEILAACAAAVCGVAISFKTGEILNDVYNSSARGQSVKDYFDDTMSGMVACFKSSVGTLDPDFDLSDLDDLDLSDVDTIDNTAVIMDRFYQQLLESTQPLSSDPDVIADVELQLEHYLDQLDGLPDDLEDTEENKQKKTPAPGGTASNEANQKICDYLNYIVHSFEANSTFYQPGSFNSGDGSKLILSPFTLSILAEYMMNRYSGVSPAGDGVTEYTTTVENLVSLDSCTGGKSVLITENATGYQIQFDASALPENYVFYLKRHLWSNTYQGGSYWLDYQLNCYDSNMGAPMKVNTNFKNNGVDAWCILTKKYNDRFQEFLDYFFKPFTDLSYGPVTTSNFNNIGLGATDGIGGRITASNYKSHCVPFSFRSYTLFDLFGINFQGNAPYDPKSDVVNEDGVNPYMIMNYIPYSFEGIPVLPYDISNEDVSALFGGSMEVSYTFDRSQYMDLYNKGVEINVDDVIDIISVNSSGSSGSDVFALAADMSDVIVLGGKASVDPDLTLSQWLQDVQDYAVANGYKIVIVRSADGAYTAYFRINIFSVTKSSGQYYLGIPGYAAAWTFNNGINIVDTQNQKLVRPITNKSTASPVPADVVTIVYADPSLNFGSDSFWTPADNKEFEDLVNPPEPVNPPAPSQPAETEPAVDPTEPVDPPAPSQPVETDPVVDPSQPSDPDIPIDPSTPVDPDPPVDDPDLNEFQLPDVTDKFPFCVPFDLIDCVKAWNVSERAPVFEVPFVVDSAGVNEMVVIDLTIFDPVIVLLRWLVLISYIVFLIVVTRQLIKG